VSPSITLLTTAVTSISTPGLDETGLATPSTRRTTIRETHRAETLKPEPPKQYALN
jgi:hypothetical protein